MPLGYNRELVESIIDKGIPCHSFNLLTQIISLYNKKHEKKLEKKITVATLLDDKETQGLNLERRQIDVLDNFQTKNDNNIS